jgi:hypothetical protein
MPETLVAALMFAQPFMGAGSTEGAAPVSPSGMATDMCVVDAAGRGTLELPILWRGSPGWLRKSAGGASGGIRRSPELVEFLRCDVPVPDLQPYEQQVFDMWCRG